MSFKLSSAYKSIGEVVKILNNEEPKQTKVNAHTIRFWETQFNQIKPKVFNNKRRHYDDKNIEVLKKRIFEKKKKERFMNRVIMGTFCLSVAILGYIVV